MKYSPAAKKLAKAMATDLVKQSMRAHGHKAVDYKPSAINAAANQLLADVPEILKKAQREVNRLH